MVGTFFKGAAVVVAYMALILVLVVLPWKVTLGLLLLGAFVCASFIIGLIIQQ